MFAVVIDEVLLTFFGCNQWFRCLRQQEGQHPLTGQRAANFRLLAN